MLPNITRVKGVRWSGTLLVGSTVLLFLGFGIGVCLNEYYTPGHTNAFSYLVQGISQLIMLVSQNRCNSSIDIRRLIGNVGSKLLSVY